MGADYYQTESEIASLLAQGKVPMGIGRNTKIRWVSNEAFAFLIDMQKTVIHYNTICLCCSNCIIDKNARIGKDVIIKNKEVSSTTSLLLDQLNYIYREMMWFVWVSRESKKEIDLRKDSTYVRGSLSYSRRQRSTMEQSYRYLAGCCHCNESPLKDSLALM